MIRPVYLLATILLLTCSFFSLPAQQGKGLVRFEGGFQLSAAFLKATSLYDEDAFGEGGYYGLYSSRWTIAAEPGLHLSILVPLSSRGFLKVTPSIQYFSRELKYRFAYDGGGYSPHNPAYHNEFQYEAHYRYISLMLPVVFGCFLGKNKNVYAAGGLLIGRDLAGSGEITRFQSNGYSDTLSVPRIIKIHISPVFEMGMYNPGGIKSTAVYLQWNMADFIFRRPIIFRTALTFGIGYTFNDRKKGEE